MQDGFITSEKASPIERALCRQAARVRVRGISRALRYGDGRINDGMADARRFWLLEGEERLNKRTCIPAATMSSSIMLREAGCIVTSQVVGSSSAVSRQGRNEIDVASEDAILEGSPHSCRGSSEVMEVGVPA
jgi:hypothetical protein